TFCAKLLCKIPAWANRRPKDILIIDLFMRVYNLDLYSSSSKPNKIPFGLSIKGLFIILLLPRRTEFALFASLTAACSSGLSFLQVVPFLFTNCSQETSFSHSSSLFKVAGSFL